MQEKETLNLRKVSDVCSFKKAGCPAVETTWACYVTDEQGDYQP